MKYVCNSVTIPDGEKLVAGSKLEIHVAPLGAFDGIAKSGPASKPHRVRQVFSLASLQPVVDAFVANGREILVDADHSSAQSHGSTEALGWITKLDLRSNGLWATVQLTDIGAAAVQNRRFRYVSPNFGVKPSGPDEVVPVCMLSLAFTNQPNLPLERVLNSAQEDSTTVEQEEPNMEKILEALGLPAEAGAAEILAAIDGLKKQIADAKKAALEAEADKVADEHGAQIANREAFRDLYVANKEAALGVLRCIAAPVATPVQTVCNSSAGTAPTVEPVVDHRAKLSALPPNERRAYYEAHKADIDK